MNNFNNNNEASFNPKVKVESDWQNIYLNRTDVVSNKDKNGKEYFTFKVGMYSFFVSAKCVKFFKKDFTPFKNGKVSIGINKKWDYKVYGDQNNKVIIGQDIINEYFRLMNISPFN